MHTIHATHAYGIHQHVLVQAPTDSSEKLLHHELHLSVRVQSSGKNARVTFTPYRVKIRNVTHTYWYWVT